METVKQIVNHNKKAAKGFLVAAFTTATPAFMAMAAVFKGVPIHPIYGTILAMGMGGALNLMRIGNPNKDRIYGKTRRKINGMLYGVAATIGLPLATAAGAAVGAGVAGLLGLGIVAGAAAATGALAAVFNFAEPAMKMVESVNNFSWSAAGNMTVCGAILGAFATAACGRKPAEDRDSFIAGYGVPAGLALSAALTFSAASGYLFEKPVAAPVADHQGIAVERQLTLPAPQLAP